MSAIISFSSLASKIYLGWYLIDSQSLIPFLCYISSSCSTAKKGNQHLSTESFYVTVVELNQMSLILDNWEKQKKIFCAIVNKQESKPILGFDARKQLNRVIVGVIKVPFL